MVVWAYIQYKDGRARSYCLSIQSVLFVHVQLI